MFNSFHLFDKRLISNLRPVLQFTNHHRMKTCLTLLLALLCINCLFAQWEPTNGPFGGWILGLQQNDDFMFASTEHGIYRSPDGGKNWMRLNFAQNLSTSVNSMGVNGSNLVALVADQAGQVGPTLFKSDDNGDTWAITNLPDTVGYADIVMTDFAIYIMLNHSLIFSTDGGETWQNSSVNPSLPYPDGITTHNNQVYVGGQGKLFISASDSDTWTEHIIQGMTATVNSTHAFDEVIFVREYQYGDLFFSTDGGQAWQKSPGIDWGNVWTNFVHIGNAYYANYGGTIWKTEDLGWTWNEIPVQNYQNFYRLLNYGNDIVGGTLSRGIMRSTDLGNSFHPSNQGLDAAVTTVLTIGNGEILAGCNYMGMYKYDQSQEIWDSTIYSPVQYELNDIAVNGDKLFVVRDFGEVARSDDGGLNWVDVTPGDPFGSSDFDKLTLDGNTLYAAGVDILGVGTSPLHKTIDLGQNWTPVTIQTGGSNHQPYFFAKNDNYTFMADFQNVFRSADGGQTWQIVNQGLDFTGQFSVIVQDLIVANDLVFVIIGSDTDYTHLYVSYDDGGQWELSENGITFLNFYGGVRHVIGVGGVLVASTYGYADGVFISLDNAQTWQPFNEGLSGRAPGRLVADGGYLYVPMYGQGVWRRSLADLNLQPVTGKVYRDDNNNGTQDNGEAPLPGIVLKLEEVSSYAVSGADGSYKVYSSFLAPDVLSVSPPNAYAIANPANYSINQPTAGKDFGIYFPPGIEDLSVELTQYGVMRPGFGSHYGLAYKNKGTTVTGGTVQLDLDAALTFVSADPAPDQVLGNQLTWSFSNLDLLESRFINIAVATPTTVQNGTVITTLAEAHPTGNDAAPNDNLDSEQTTVVGSYDPNDKRVEPGETLSLEQYEAGTPLTYTIRFQNTGTYQADKVLITDQLSQLLDVSSFEFLASSHPCTYDIRGNGFAEFHFDMINLPDSTSNEAASHGFVKFSVQPRADLSVGARILNSAAIYFDFNLPVLTNQVSTELVSVSSLRSRPKPGGQIAVFPNPSSGDFTVILESERSEKAQIAVYDANGKTIFSTNTETNRPVRVELPGNIGTGLFFIKGRSNGATYASRTAVLR